MVNLGIMQKYSDGSFKPNNAVSRGDFAKMLVIALDLELKNPENATFEDVEKGSSLYKYVETAKYYLTGFRNSLGDFYRPEQDSVREDMAVALVKAKGKTKLTDLSGLNVFEDKSSISSALSGYAAAAVKEGVINGTIENGKKYFRPQKVLTRAEAAQLLYNTVISQKVTYEDDEKVTYDDSDDNSSNTNTQQPQTQQNNTNIANVSAKVNGEYITLTWNPVSSSNFNYYKVVLSKYDNTPVYPENGYITYISDASTTSYSFRAGQGYNGNNDFGGEIRSGETYYLSITSVYNNGKYPGNVIRVTAP